jgi:CRISPR-associated protein Cas6
MTAVVAGPDLALDVIFSIEGQALPVDHAQALQTALCQVFPWLQTDAVAAVLPLKRVTGDDGQSLVSKRSKLILRIQHSRLPDIMAARSIELAVAGCRLRLANPHPRALQPHATLYAYRVAATGADEVAFMEEVNQQLAQMSVRGERVCGKRSQMTIAGQPVDTYSLMLHGLPPDQSLRLQNFGLGPHRLLGCGVFVPHKSAAAV